MPSISNDPKKPQQPGPIPGGDDGNKKNGEVPDPSKHSFPPRQPDQQPPGPGGGSGGNEKNAGAQSLSDMSGPSIDRAAEQKANQPQPSKMAAEVSQPQGPSQGAEKAQPQPSKMAAEVSQQQGGSGQSQQKEQQQQQTK